MASATGLLAWGDGQQPPASRCVPLWPTLGETMELRQEQRAAAGITTDGHATTARCAWSRSGSEDTTTWMP